MQTLVRAGAVVAVAALATSTTHAGTASAAALPDNPAAAGAAFLVHDLQANGGYVAGFMAGQADLGLTMDAVLALGSLRHGQDQAAATTDYVAAHVTDYIAYEDTYFAGPTTKALLTATSQGRDPRRFGGHDLVATVQRMETSTGQLADVGEYGGSGVNMFGQAFGLLGLKRAGVNPSPASVNWMIDQQCDDGSFPIFTGGSECRADRDATSLAITSLVGVGEGDRPEVQRAVDYLVGEQQEDGAFGGGVSTESANANSTGLAGMALRVAGRAAEAERAAQYVASLQLGCDAPEPLQGAIAYNRQAYDALVSQGASAAVSDQERRTSAQALLALAPDDYTTAGPHGAADVPAVTCDGSGAPTDPTPTDEPTTTEPTTSVPTPTEPTTTEPTTSEPTTTRPTPSEPTSTTAPTTSQPTATATSEDGASAPVSDSDQTPERPGTVETGDWAGGATRLGLAAALLAAAVAGAVVLLRRRVGTHR